MCIVNQCWQPADVEFGGEGVCLQHYFEQLRAAQGLGLDVMFGHVLVSKGWSEAASMVERSTELQARSSWTTPQGIVIFED